jgi:hypothetical protein
MKLAVVDVALTCNSDKEIQSTGPHFVIARRRNDAITTLAKFLETPFSFFQETGELLHDLFLIPMQW